MLGVFERTRQSTRDRESHFLPKMDTGFIGLDGGVVLHGWKASSFARSASSACSQAAASGLTCTGESARTCVPANPEPDADALRAKLDAALYCSTDETA